MEEIKISLFNVFFVLLKDDGEEGSYLGIYFVTFRSLALSIILYFRRTWASITSKCSISHSTL